MGCSFSRLVRHKRTDSMKRLPPELKALILGFLLDDKSALCACSLVCRDLHAYARLYLFQQVIVTPDDLLTFSHLLEFSKSDVSQSVRELVFTNFIGPILGGDCTLDHVHKRLSSLKNVTSLVLSKIDFIHLPPTLLSSFPAVRRLDLKNLHFENFEDFVILITSFPSLARFSFSDVQWPSAHRPRPLIRRLWTSPPIVSFLELNDTNARRFVDWFLEQTQTPVIDALHFHTHRYTPNDSVRLLIEVCCKSLNQIQFDLTFVNDIQGMYSTLKTSQSSPDPILLGNLHKSIDLGLCRNLKIIHLHNIILLSGFQMTTMTTRWVPELISQITSNDIEEVIFTLLVRHHTDLDCFDWAGTATALSGIQTSHTRQILFNIVGSEMDEAAATTKITEGALAEFTERGLLRVKFLENSS